MLAYLIVNHDGMAERKMSDAQASQAQFDEYVRKTAGGTGGAAAEIEKAKHDSSTVARSRRLSSTPSRPRRSPSLLDWAHMGS